MRTPIYFPALSCATTNYLAKTDKEIMIGNIKRNPRFYNNTISGYFYHPFSLWSAATHFNKVSELKKTMQINKKNKVFIDSGGYQLASGAISEKKYGNKIALDWSEKNGDIFPILDRPLIQGCNFQKHLDLSVESAEYYSNNRSVEGTNVLNVLSARNLNEMESWYKSISKYKFEGWAHGGHRGNMIAIIKGLLFLVNKGEYESADIKYHHVFGISRMDAMVYFAVIQQILEEQGQNIHITYDSSYFQRNLAFGGYFLFPTYTGIQQVRLSNRYDYSKLTPEDVLPCSCEVCKTVTNLKGFMDNTMEFYLLGILHNLNLMLKYKYAVEAIVRMNIQEVINSSMPSVIRNNIKILKLAFSDPKKGYDIIDRNFINSGTSLKQESISLFDIVEVDEENMLDKKYSNTGLREE